VLDPDRPEGRARDNAGRVEDVATGSAAGPAAGYLLHHGVRPAGETILVHQSQFTRAAQHDRGPPRPRRPTLGRRADGAGRGRTLPRPSDLIAAASTGWFARISDKRSNTFSAFDRMLRHTELRAISS
jgi:hypothetical protein